MVSKHGWEVESMTSVYGLIRNAENGCYVMQTIRHPVPVQTEVIVNGAAFDLAAYPPPQRRSQAYGGDSHGTDRRTLHDPALAALNGVPLI